MLRPVAVAILLLSGITAGCLTDPDERTRITYLPEHVPRLDLTTAIPGVGEALMDTGYNSTRYHFVAGRLDDAISAATSEAAETSPPPAARHELPAHETAARERILGNLQGNDSTVCRLLAAELVRTSLQPQPASWSPGEEPIPHRHTWAILHVAERLAQQEPCAPVAPEPGLVAWAQAKTSTAHNTSGITHEQPSQEWAAFAPRHGFANVQAYDTLMDGVFDAMLLSRRTGAPVPTLEELASMGNETKATNPTGLRAMMFSYATDVFDYTIDNGYHHPTHNWEIYWAFAVASGTPQRYER